MSDLLWLTDAQMARLEPFFPKSHSFSFSEFQIIGRVGKLMEVGPTLWISLASEYGRKDDCDEFQQNTFWNEVTLFNEATIT